MHADVISNKQQACPNRTHQLVPAHLSELIYPLISVVASLPDAVGAPGCTYLRNAANARMAISTNVTT